MFDWVLNAPLQVKIKTPNQNVIHIVLGPLLLTLNIFYTFVFIYILHISHIHASIIYSNQVNAG